MMLLGIEHRPKCVSLHPSPVGFTQRALRGVRGPIDVRRAEILMKRLQDVVHFSVQLWPRRDCGPGFAISGNTQPACQRYDAGSQGHAGEIASLQPAQSPQWGLKATLEIIDLARLYFLEACLLQS